MSEPLHANERLCLILRDPFNNGVPEFATKKAADVIEALTAEVAHYKAEGERLSVVCQTRSAEIERFKKMYLDAACPVGDE